MTAALLQTKGVSKFFKKFQALDHVSISLAPGERVALLGHNGAGKTTLFRMILGFTQPSGGTLSLSGEMPGSNIARQLVSYLPENVMFPKALSGREIVCFYARLKGTSKKDAMAYLERVGLGDAADQRIGTYSKGMRQRLGLAQALAGNPKLLLLDEPTSGLDPLSRSQFYTLVDEVAAAGTAVLLSSHSLSELEAKTDRVAILRKGRLVADAPLTQLQAEADVPLRIRVSAHPGRVDEVNRRLGGRRMNGRSVELLCPVSDKMIRLADISALGSMVTDFDVLQPSLDDVYNYFSTRFEEDQRQ